MVTTLSPAVGCGRLMVGIAVGVGVRDDDVEFGVVVGVAVQPIKRVKAINDVKANFSLIVEELEDCFSGLILLLFKPNFKFITVGT